jgi:hypothetical protein
VDLAQILGQLWRRRGLVAIGAVVALLVGVSVAYRVTSSGLEKRSLELGVAKTTVLVDTQSSSVLDLTVDPTPLSDRIRVYKAVAMSDPVLKLLARDVGVPPEAIAATAAASGEESADQRADAIVQEEDTYRVAYDVTDEQPTIEIATQAPTAAAAVRLANGAARALRTYVVRQQNAQNLSPGSRVAVRQIGAARGGVLNSGANVATAALGGLATFVAICLLILFGDRLRVDVLRSRVGAYGGRRPPRPQAEAAAESHFDGHGPEEHRGLNLHSDRGDDRRRSRSRV